MTLLGRVRGGVVVPEGKIALPEGTQVQIVVPPAEEPLLDENGQTLGQKLMKYAGTITDLPPDAARNHDHYLYGTPKR